MTDQPPLRNARAAIFDLDGTLLDTLGDLADSVNVALGESSYPQHTEQTICGFIGDGMEMLLRRAMPSGAADDSAALARCLASFKEHYGKHFANRTKPYEQVPELLASLREREIPLGILSNKPHGFTIKCAQTFFGGSGELFSVVFGQRDGVPKKPDPAGALEAAGALGVAAEHCLYVGDSGVDMQTGLAAGMVPVGVAWGFRPVEELRAAGAAAIVDRPDELLAAFRADGSR